ncbi:3901_t:CDS:1, partial [Dentiscutata heterogama]
NNEYNSNSITCTSSYANSNIDPYADPYADPYVDPYSDSYADLCINPYTSSDAEP